MFIIGCHRSGTSYFSNVLHNSLSQVGKLVVLDTNWVGSNLGNKEGHFESKKIKNFNKEILKVFGFSWNYPPLYNPRWDILLDSLNIESLRIDLKSWIDNKAWIDKDPRLSITRDFYLHLFLEDKPSFWVVRDPLKVCNSLFTRDAINGNEALGLWLIYNFHILNSKSSNPKTILNFDMNEKFCTKYSNSIANHISTYLSFDIKEKDEFNTCLKKNFSEKFNKSILRSGNQLLSDICVSNELKDSAIACYQLLCVEPDDLDFESLKDSYNKIYFSVFNILTEIFPFPYSKSLCIENNDDYLPDLKYTSKQNNFLFFKDELKKINLTLNNLKGNGELKKENLDLNKKVELLVKEKMSIKNSLSWKLTMPLRLFQKALKNLLIK